jgi:hypothetical protein
MKNSLSIKIVAGIAISTFITLLIIPDEISRKSIFSAATGAVGYTSLLAIFFAKWAWKWKILSSLGRIHKVPVLEGIWEGTFESVGNEKTPDDRKNGKVIVEISQPSISSVKVVLQTDETESRSLGEQIIHSNDGTTQLLYTYLSEPKTTVRARSAISYGSAKLRYYNKENCRLEGSYWTDQQTIGNLNLTKTKKSE